MSTLQEAERAALAAEDALWDRIAELRAVVDQLEGESDIEAREMIIADLARAIKILDDANAELASACRMAWAASAPFEPEAWRDFP